MPGRGIAGSTLSAMQFPIKTPTSAIGPLSQVSLLLPPLRLRFPALGVYSATAIVVATAILSCRAAAVMSDIDKYISAYYPTPPFVEAGRSSQPVEIYLI